MHGGIRPDEIDAPDHVLEAAEPEPRHPAADVFGEEQHEGDDMLGPARKPGAQHGILRRDADRAGVQMADPHHHAARCDEWRSCERELVGAEQCTHDHVTPGLHLPVREQRDPAPQALRGEHLLRFGKSQFPRHACVLDGGERRSPGATFIARDDNVVRARLGNSRGHSPDTRFGNELDADPRLRDSRSADPR